MVRKWKFFLMPYTVNFIIALYSKWGKEND